MLLNINYNSPIAIYEQLVKGILQALDEGRLNEGDPLPSIRKLSSQLDISVNTVARAYQELEREGILESGGRRGTFIRKKDITRNIKNEKLFKSEILNLIQSGKNRDEIELIFKKSMESIFN